MTAELQRLTENNRQEFLGIIDDLLDRNGLAQSNFIKLKAEDGYDVETYRKYVPFLKAHSAIEDQSSVMDFIDLEASVYVNENQLKELKNLLLNGTAQKMYTTASISFDGKVIKLNYAGSTSTIWEFRNQGSNAFMHSIFLKLFKNPDEPISPKSVDHRIATTVKDFPKTVGFSGILKKLFFEVNSKEQTLTLHTKLNLTSEQAEMLTNHVNKL